MGVRKSDSVLFQANHTATNLLDSDTYAYGGLFGDTASTTLDITRIYIPVDCVIRRVIAWFFAFGVAGSNENVALYLRVNSTTNYPIETKGFSPTKHTIFFNDSLNIPLSPGDYFELRFDTPAWVTNPTTVYNHTTIYGVR